MKYLFFSLFVSFLSFSQNKTVIKCGKFADVKTGKMLENQTIIILNNTIEKIIVGDYTLHATDVFYDLSKYTVMPGLIDMHVHVEHQTSAKQYLEEFTLNEADVAFRAVGYVKTTLNCGFTSVRDL